VTVALLSGAFMAKARKGKGQKEKNPVEGLPESTVRIMGRMVRTPPKPKIKEDACSISGGLKLAGEITMGS